LKDSHNFVFNSDILAAQTESFKAAAERQVANYSLTLDSLQRLRGEMKKGIEPPTKTGEWYDFYHTCQLTTTWYKYIFSRRTYAGSPFGPAIPPLYKLQVLDKDGQEINNINLPSEKFVSLPQNIAEIKELTKRLIASFEKELSEIQRRLNTLISQTPEVWSFWDFLYFSVITQTTVGYGDILPNSTLIRVVVTAQVMIGIALLVVVINLAFLKKAQERQ